MLKRSRLAATVSPLVITAAVLVLGSTCSSKGASTTTGPEPTPAPGIGLSNDLSTGGPGSPDPSFTPRADAAPVGPLEEPLGNPPASGRGSTDGEAVTLAFAGDINYDGSLANRLTSSPGTILDPIKPLLSSADLTVANLETAITTRGTRAPKQFTFRAPPAAFDALAAAGIDVVSMANNHGLDYGPVGLSDSLAAIGASGFPVIGIGEDADAAFRPHVAEIKGRRIAVIGATQVMDSNLKATWTATATQPGMASAYDVDRLTRAVRDARTDADTVVVFLHWGTEKNECPNPSQLALAPRLVDAGADVVVGSHAHRVLGGGYHGTAYVDYGLGNFQFAAHSGPGAESGVLTLTVDGRQVTDPIWHPARINGSAVPVPLTGPAAQAASADWDAKRPCTRLARDPTP